MDEYIFPFNDVNYFNNIFSNEILAFDQYSNLVALSDRRDLDSTLDHDHIDNSIIQLNTVDCDYIDMGNYVNLPPENNLSVFHLNINSIPKNLASLISNFPSTKNLPPIIAISETKLTHDTEQLYHIEGYQSFFNSNCSHSGGLALYIRSDIEVESFKKHYYMLPHFEAITVSVSTALGPIIICLIYRRPSSNIDQFLLQYGNLQRELGRQRCLFLGDMNLNLLCYQSSSIVRNFVDANYQNSFYPIINRPTRVGSHSANVIDHAWSNFIHVTPTTGLVIKSDISDHFGIGILLKDAVAGSVRDTTSYTYRVWDGITNGSLAQATQNKLLSTNFQDENSSIDQLLNSLINSIRSSIQETCPLVTKTTDPHKTVKSKPWITSELRAKIKEKNKLYSKYCKRPLTYGQEYRTARNSLTNQLRQAESKYYQTLLNNHAGDSKKTWNTISSILNPAKSSSPSITKITHQDITTQDPSEIAKAFNEYLITAPKIISDSLPQPTLNFSSFLPPPLTSSFSFHLITPDIVRQLIDSLKSCGGSGSVDIPNKVLKALKDVIDVPLSLIFNRCINEGYFPDALKIAQVQPVFKSGEKSSICNFRPISILSGLSKIFEKFLNAQLTEYFETNQILSANQWGFRGGISTEMAIAKFIQKVINGFNDKKFGIGVFLDLQKAFDLVDPNILLSKLQNYGVDNLSTNLIKSFLTNRKQCVKINNHLSSVEEVSLGTPQGSSLSPLLFIIFINDICRCSSIVHFNLFADDTSIYLNHDNIETLFSLMENELQKIGAWISANKLGLNVKKSAYLLFSGKKQTGNIPRLSIFGKPISRVHDFKFLGLTIDDRLSWKTHARIVQGKLSRLTGVLSKIQYKLTNPALRTLYFALAFSHLRYGIIFWSSAPNNEFNRIFSLQKRIIRIINGKNYIHPTENLFKNSNILKLKDVSNHEMGKFIYSDLNYGHHFNLSPRSNIHSHETRNRHQLSLPQPRSNILINSFFHQGVQYYNNIPDIIKSSTSKKVFKNKLKYQILATYGN